MGSFASGFSVPVGTRRGRGLNEMGHRLICNKSQYIFQHGEGDQVNMLSYNTRLQGERDEGPWIKNAA